MEPERNILTMTDAQAIMQINNELRAELTAAQAEIARLKAEREWRPIAEATDHDERIIMIVGCPGEPVYTVGEGFWDDWADEWCWSIDKRPTPRPTHYMPLPPPPSAT